VIDRDILHPEFSLLNNYSKGFKDLVGLTEKGATDV